MPEWSIWVIAAIIFFVMAKVSSTVKMYADNKKKADTAAMVETLSSYDYMVYWIGTPPSELTELIGDNITVVPPEMINEDTLPSGTSVSEISRKDVDGYTYEEHSRREYADQLLICINCSEPLSDESWDTIRKCVVGNDIPVFLIGDTSISGFRKSLLMSNKVYSDTDTMLYTTNNGIDPVTISNDDVKAGGNKFASAMIPFLKEVFDLPRPTMMVVETVNHDLSVYNSWDDSDEVSLITDESDGTMETIEDPEIESTVIYYYGN